MYLASLKRTIAYFNIKKGINMSWSAAHHSAPNRVEPLSQLGFTAALAWEGMREECVRTTDGRLGARGILCGQRL